MAPDQDQQSGDQSNWQQATPSAPPQSPTPPEPSAQNGWQQQFTPTPQMQAQPQPAQPQSAWPQQQQPAPQMQTPSPLPAAEPQSSPDDDMHKPEFASLNLSAGEKVLSEMHRHPIGVLQIYITTAIVMLAIFVATGALVKFAGSKDVIAGAPVSIPVWAIFGIGAILALIVAAVAAISIKVYNGNRLYLTNESVIQKVQNSLFDTREQQIALGRIEDVSYEQRGLVQHMFNYGTLRLSTEGQETTYYFHYAIQPREQAAEIINAQEAYERLHGPHRY